MPSCASKKAGKPRYTIGQIVRQFGAAYVEKYQPDYRTRTILAHIANCKTAALGGHQTVCKACNNTVYSYNSCGDAIPPISRFTHLKVSQTFILRNRSLIRNAKTSKKNCG